MTKYLYLFLAIQIFFYTTNVADSGHPAFSTTLNSSSDEFKTEVFIVHGTFATDFHWYQQGGYFYETLKRESLKMFGDDCLVTPWRWNGGLCVKDWVEGAENLCAYILESKRENVCVGHSHGGNLVNLATQMLEISYQTAQNQNVAESVKTLAENLEKTLEAEEHKVNHHLDALHGAKSGPSTPASFDTLKLLTDAIEKTAKLVSLQICRDGVSIIKPRLKWNFLLGVPVNDECLLPSLAISPKNYNLYSKADLVQPIFGLYSRTYGSEHRHIFNIETYFNECDGSEKLKRPSHGEMHADAIAYRLLNVPGEFDVEQSFKTQETDVIFYFDLRNPSFRYIPEDKIVPSPSLSLEEIWNNICDILSTQGSLHRE